MDEIDLELVLMQELLILFKESLTKHRVAEGNHREAKAWVALGEVVLCQRMMQFYLELGVENEPYEDFICSTEGTLEYQEALYRDARQERNWHAAVLALGRVRLLKNMFKRLADVERQKMHMIPRPTIPILH